MKDGERDGSAAERALNAFEVVGALVACALIATMPAWLGFLAYLVEPAAGLVVGALSGALVLALPAMLRTRRTRQLNGYERWGAHVAMALRLPLDLARGAADRERRRALGAGETSAAVKALEPPQHDDIRER